MNNILTIADVQQAMAYLRLEPLRILYEDDYQIITGNDLGAQEIKLKEKGMRWMNDFIVETNNKIENKEIMEIFGIKVCVSDKVK